MMHFRPISDQNILDEGYNTNYTLKLVWEVSRISDCESHIISHARFFFFFFSR